MICKKCGKDIDDIALYCMYCGHKQTVGNDSPTKNTRKRGNGQGSVYKLPDNKWACQRQKYVGGRRKTCRKKGFKTKKEAMEYLPQLSFSKHKSKVITILQAYKAISPSLDKLSDKRRAIYDSAYKRLKDVEFCDISELEISDLQSIVDDIEGGYYSKRYVKDLLNKLYEYAYADGKVDRNIAPYIVLPKNESSSEKVIYTSDEVRLLWQCWNAGSEMAGYLLICLYCCLRTGELWSIKCNSVDFDKHLMYGGIKTVKGKYAPIFIADIIEPVVKCFVDKGGTTLYSGTATQFYRSWQEFKAENHLRDELQPYCGRHSCTTILTAAGLPEAVIMQITRHTKYDTTLQYTHIDTDSVLEKMNYAVKSL